MPRVHIVTDSCARFEQKSLPRDLNISVVPIRIRLEARELLDGIDLEAEDVMQRIQLSGQMPSVEAPTVDTYAEMYDKLSKITNQIVVITSAQNLSASFANAQSARAGYMGRCDIIVLDSRSTAAGQGYLVEAVARAADKGVHIDEIVRIARAVIPRIYAVYYTSDLNYVERANLIGKSQAIVGRMMEVKPLVTIEDGELITMEKARTHGQAIDKMMEFVAEFTNIEKLAVLQSTTRVTDRTRMLQDRLALELSRVHYPIMVYDSLIASYLGPDAMGMVVLEGDI